MKTSSSSSSPPMSCGQRQQTRTHTGRNKRGEAVTPVGTLQLQGRLRSLLSRVAKCVLKVYSKARLGAPLRAQSARETAPGAVAPAQGSVLQTVGCRSEIWALSRRRARQRWCPAGSGGLGGAAWANPGRESPPLEGPPPLLPGGAEATGARGRRSPPSRGEYQVPKNLL